VGYCWASSNDGNNCSIPPILDVWVYIEPIHEPLDGPLYTWAQYTPTATNHNDLKTRGQYSIVPSTKVP